MEAESITLVLNAWILAFRKLFEDIGLDRVIRKRLRKALVFKYDSSRTASNHDHGDRRVRVLLEEVPAGQADDRIWIRADA